MKKILLSLLGVTMLAFACKKKDDAPATDYTNLIVGKWTYINEIGLFTTTAGAVTRDTLTFNNGSYSEFKANNNFIVYVNDASIITRDSGVYSIVGNQLYTTTTSGLKDTVTIQSIGSSNLTLYTKDLSVPSVTQEAWSYFKK